jgi:hypothetical protein
MASKADFIGKTQAMAQRTFEIVTEWNTLIKEAKQLGYTGVLGSGIEAPELALTDADITGARGDPFDAATLIAVIVGAEMLSNLIEGGGHLAAMCKIKA